MVSTLPSRFKKKKRFSSTAFTRNHHASCTTTLCGGTTCTRRQSRSGKFRPMRFPMHIAAPPVYYNASHPRMAAARRVDTPRFFRLLYFLTLEGDNFCIVRTRFDLRTLKIQRSKSGSKNDWNTPLRTYILLLHTIFFFTQRLCCTHLRTQWGYRGAQNLPKTRLHPQKWHLFQKYIICDPGEGENIIRTVTSQVEMCPD